MLLSRVYPPQMRRREVEQRRVDRVQRRRDDHVREAHVDLKGHANVTEMGGQAGPYATIVGLLRDG